MNKNKRYSYVSIALIALSLGVALMSRFGGSIPSLQFLFISDPNQTGFSTILSGQVWRLLTPAFIHFGPMHLIFNMLWVWDLGTVIENKKGPVFLIGLTLAIAVASNVIQYLMTQSPFFGGMSGVVYGLFSYIWIRGRYDGNFGVGMRKTTVHMMLAWFVLCWTGLLGPIANWAHTAGLMLGAAYAYIECRRAGTVPPSASGSSYNSQNLEYFSTADILKIEAQRSWVRDQYLPEVREQFNTVEGKLKILHAILHQKNPDLRPQNEVHALEIVFADALMQETVTQWAVINDGDLRTPVLVSKDAPLVIFPLVAANRLVLATDMKDFQELFLVTVNTIRKALQARA